MRLLPALHLRDGGAVRPGPGGAVLDRPALEFASEWIRDGAEWLQVVDTDASVGRGDHRLLIEALLDSHRVKIEVGGGIRTREQAKWFLDRGAERIVVGTAGVEDPRWLAELSQEHPARVVLALDARNGRLFTRRWSRATGLDVIEVLGRVAKLPLAGILFTSLDTQGPRPSLDHDAVVQVCHAAAHPLAVAGGVATYEDLRFLRALGVEAALLDDALLDGRVRLAQAMNLISGV